MRFALLPVLALVACSSGESSDPTAFEGGTFTFTTTGVDDGCLDGAFDTILMPTGEATGWENTVELPAWDDLPQTYTISVQEPYGDVEVTVEQGEAEGQMVVNGARAENVEFDAESYPGCFVNNDIDVLLDIVSHEELTGSATLHTDSFDEATCPAISTAPETSCDVTLDLVANYAGTEH